MPDEVDVDVLLHKFLDAEVAGIETVVYVKEEDWATIWGRGC